MKAMILAAGYGKRLRPLTLDLPKPLITVQNKPVLDWIFEQLLQYGIKEVVINTHYLHQKIEHHLSSKRLDISYTLSYEKKILGTGGGLSKTVNFWGDGDFYLCNADILCTADLSKFFAYHAKQEAMVTLAVNRKVSDSMLLIDERGQLVGIKKGGEQKVVGAAQGEINSVGFCGLHVISPMVFSHFGRPVEFSIIDEYLQLIAKGLKIATWDIADAFWVDIGNKDGLAYANNHFPGFN